MRIPIAALLSLLIPASASAQTAVIPLWAKGAPGYENLRDVPEQAHDYWVRNINNPSLTVFLPPQGKANGTAVVVAPGGGFKELVFDAEGRQPAALLNSVGVTAFVLKYRLPKADQSPYKMGAEQEDVIRAMRVVRSRAGEFGIDPNRIGILGFSAGGVLVMDVAFGPVTTDPAAPDPVDRTDPRPSFEMLVYPGGDNVPKVAPRDAGPAFIVCAGDDEYKCDDASLLLLTKLHDVGVSVEAHFIAQGKHAFNMGARSPYLAVRHWPQRMIEWMDDRGFLKAATAGTPGS